MHNSLNNIPEPRRLCPLCKTEGKIVRIIPFGINQAEKQYKLGCPQCEHSWVYHSDE